MGNARSQRSIYGLLVGLLIAAPTSAPAATITPISGFRSVSVSINNDGFFSDSRTGPISGPWSDEVEITRPLNFNGMPVGSMTCLASQQSNVGAQSIVSTGRVIVNFVGNGAPVIGQAQSLLDIRFTLDSATPFSLQMLSTDPVPFDGRIDVALFTSSDQFITSARPELPGPTFGQLAAGQYHIVSTIFGFANPPRAGQSDFNYSWAFIVPTPTAAPLTALGLLILTRRRRST